MKLVLYRDSKESNYPFKPPTLVFSMMVFEKAAKRIRIGRIAMIIVANIIGYESVCIFSNKNCKPTASVGYFGK